MLKSYPQGRSCRILRAAYNEYKSFNNIPMKQYKQVRLDEDGLTALHKAKFRLKKPSLNSVVLYWDRLERSIKKADPELYEKLRFNLS